MTLDEFVLESNKIERIEGYTEEEVRALEDFLLQPLCLASVKEYVWRVAYAPLREYSGMNVQVGNRIPIGGGAVVKMLLEELLDDARNGCSPYEVHQRYEKLHPFMDGNGRSGRAIWLKMMGGIEKAPLGFLHTWYYQSLSNG